ncbi:unnamed protein product [Orchesella dallaii]|uniref:Uncharacterized protein n=1 Tax=Orchesella dallaii TaxID=48710 RepID=A0ABP1RRU8_9HEXA
MEKFETAMNLLKVRVQVEMSQSLRRHKEQLKMSFRSDLLKLTRKNCQLTNLLHYIQRGKKRSHCNRQFLLVDEELRLQQLERDSEIKRRSHCCCKGNKQVGDPCLFHEQDDIDCCHSADPRLQNLRTEFQKQIDKLLYELKEREEGIDELNKNVEEIHETKKTVLSPSPSSACSKEDSSTSTRSKNIKTGSKNEVGRSGAPSAAAHTDSSFIAATVAKSDVTTTTTGFVDGDDASIKPICTRSNNNNNSVGPVRNKVVKKL